MDVVIFVEDPGAAAFAGGLPAELRRRGRSSTLVARGRARDVLAADGIPFDGGSGDPLGDLEARAVLVGTAEDPDAAGLWLIDRAMERGIVAVGMVDGRAHAARRFRGRGATPLAHAPDWLAVPDAHAEEEYARLGYPRERIRVCGNPRGDAVRAVRGRLEREGVPRVRSSALPGVPAGRPVLVFACETSEGLEPGAFRRSEEYGLAGSGRREGRTEIVMEELLSAVRHLDPRPYLVARMHPKNGPDDLADLTGEFDAVSRGGSALEVMFAADVVVGMTSMALAEAALLGVPTVSIVPRGVEAEWLPTIAAGVTPCATSAEEIAPLLRRALDRGRDDGRALERMWPPGATGRVADLVEERLA